MAFSSRRRVAIVGLTKPSTSIAEAFRLWWLRISSPVIRRSRNPYPGRKKTPHLFHLEVVQGIFVYQSTEMNERQGYVWQGMDRQQTLKQRFIKPLL